ncbi:MAG: 3-isopropylmalate/(R)-2-methylmalate dehydratase small subunit [Desulforhopalus sp.]|jgi:3-isopropylmalate/(R)-2-methylmalate dehydratase small subunit
MQAFTLHTGIVVPLDRVNVDTDLIIPKQFLKAVKKTGFGPNLFDQLRYKDEGQPGMDNSTRPVNPDFILNQKRYKDASILLARENFGCGSSREHAPWALLDYGFRAIIAPSFADIFYNNCFKNGILPLVLSAPEVDLLFDGVESGATIELTVDLELQEVRVSDQKRFHFEIDPFRKTCLLKGLDDIDLTLEKEGLIRRYEEMQKKICPWLFEDVLV